MSRTAAMTVQTVKPSSNVYTVLVVVATLVQILTLVILYLRYQAIFGGSLLSA